MNTSASYQSGRASVNTSPALPVIVTSLSRLNFAADMVPASWFECGKLHYSATRPRYLSMLLLAHLGYRYTPGKDGNPKFRGDLFQWSYAAMAKKYKVSERAAQEAMAYLIEAGFVRRVIRDRVEIYPGVFLDNVTYFAPVPEAVAAITPEKPETDEDESYRDTPIAPAVAGGRSRYGVNQPASRRPYTQSPTEIFIETKNVERSQVPINKQTDVPQTETAEAHPPVKRSQRPAEEPPVSSSVVVDAPRTGKESSDPMPDAVRHVLKATKDYTSERRFRQLWLICQRDRKLQTAWFNALMTVEAAMTRRRVKCPGAYFQALLRSKMEECGGVWPDAVGQAETETPEEVRAKLAYAAGFFDA